jgi:hypothetical protein
MLRKSISKLLLWILAFAAIVYGVANISDDPNILSERVRVFAPYIQANWLTAAILISGSALAAILVWDTWCERKYERRLRSELQRAAGENFRETNAEEVLHYLLRESVWGWRMLARLNHWEMVAGHHLSEFRRGARAGLVRTVGLVSDTKRTVRPDSRYWIYARLNEKSVGSEMYGVCTEVNTTGFGYVMDLTHLSVAADDVREVWPRASWFRRVATRVWVAKKIIWYRFGPTAWLDWFQRWRIRRGVGGS